MKHLLTLTLAVIAVITASATQPLRRPFMTHHQSDGTTIEVRRVGNADFSFYVTRDGLAILRDVHGDYRYATLSDDGLAAAGIAHEKSQRTATETAGIATSIQAAERLSSLYSTTPIRLTRFASSTSDGLGGYGTPPAGSVSSIGSPVIPVIMAEFSDLAFQDTITTTKLSRWLNEEGYSDEANAVGSVRDYFIAQSDGLFSPTFKVVAKVKVSRGYAYYGANGTSAGSDLRRYDFIQEALDSTCTAGVDFTEFATSNGRVPNVCIFHAGPGEQAAFEEEAEDYLWARFSTHSFTTKTGVIINSFFLGNELFQSYRTADGKVEYSDADKNYPIPQKSTMDGIGVFCHEFSHALGLPDFYYTGSDAVVSDTLKTMWNWSLMDYGEYNYDGYRPTGYTAYERSYMGWLDVKELTEPGLYELAPFGSDGDTPQAYVIRNDANSSEYYLLENRQIDTWYPKRMGSGMLITHVDYSASAWNTTTVNNLPNHQRFEYMPADNEKEGGHYCDLYPYTDANGVTNDEFSDASIPASNVYTGTSLGKPIYGITQRDGIVTFAFMDKSLTPIHHVTSIATSSERSVFTPDGCRVTTLPVGESPHSLPAGLYIIGNGSHYEKVLIK